MDSVTLASQRSSAFRSFAAAVLLVLAAAFFFAGCTIDDTRTGVTDDNDGHSTAFSQNRTWTYEDPVKPRSVPPSRPESPKPTAKTKGRSAT